MSADASPGQIDLTASETVAALREAYDEMPMPARRYVLVALLPAVGFFFLSMIAGVALPLPLVVRLPIPLLGLLALGTATIYPKILLERRAREMENSIHLLITHMTVLSTTNIDRIEVFRRLAAEETYGALADEMGRVVQLVDTWNQSLDDACRRRAHRVPSDPLADFLDRLAYSLGAGQDLGDFLLNEQDVVISHYATVYEGALNNLEVMKDLYMSMILSMTFAMVFAVVLPVLTGTNPTTTVAAVFVLYVFVQSGFAYAIYTIAPSDPIWYHPEEIETEMDDALRTSMIGAGALIVLLSVVVFGGSVGLLPFTVPDIIPGASGLPLPMMAAIPITPLLIPGLLVRAEEGRIKGRDEEFPSFIRALGATEGAKQSTTSAVLSDLRGKDFGPLTPAVEDLYRRLNMRIEPAAAWAYFAAEARSYLIQKFSEMYLTGRQMGGDPKQLGELISDNMTEVLELREHRQQSTLTLVGILYGITAASAFAFFIGLKVVEVLSSMSLELSGSSEFRVGQLIHTEVYNVASVEYVLVLVILFNALISSILIRTVDSGHKVNSYLHFVALTWVSAVVAVGTKVLVGSFLQV